jgi:hypothetical protein
VFKKFKGSFYDVDTWARLQSFANALTEHPHLGKAIHIVHIGPGNYMDVAKLPYLLHSILAKAPNIRVLRLPVDSITIKTLHQIPLSHIEEFRGDVCFESCGRSELFLLPPVTFPRSLSAIHLTGFLQTGELQLPDEMNLQHIALVASYMDCESISKLLQACQQLKTFEYWRPMQRVPPSSKPHFNAAQISRALQRSQHCLESMCLELSDDVDAVLGPLGSFLSLRSLRVDQRNLSSRPILPSSLMEMRIRFLEQPKLSLLNHLAYESCTSLLLLQNVYFDCEPKEDEFPELNSFDPKVLGFDKRISLFVFRKYD